MRFDPFGIQARRDLRALREKRKDAAVERFVASLSMGSEEFSAQIEDAILRLKQRRGESQ